MQLQALKDQIIHGRPVKAGAVFRVPPRFGEKLIREGLAKPREHPRERLETK